MTRHGAPVPEAFEILARTPLPLVTGKTVEAVVFGCDAANPEVVALVHRNRLASAERAVVRIHSACITSEVFGSSKCDCAAQLDAAIARISEADWGVLVYLLRHEGRGIGLVNKLRAYALQDQGLDTVDANVALGFGPDDRDFAPAVWTLKRLGVRSLALLTNNPDKETALRAAGLDVQRIAMDVPITKDNRRYLASKRNYFGHLLWRDPHTEFLTATALAETLAQPQRGLPCVSAIVLHVDSIEDARRSQGAAAAEELAGRVARMVRHCDALQGAPVARILDARFVIVLRNRDLEQAQAIALELDSATRELDQAMAATGQNIEAITFSIGVAGGGPDADAAAVVTHAIAAVETALRQGGNRVVQLAPLGSCEG